MLSIRFKLISALTLTCLLVGATVMFATPHMVKHEMLEGALRKQAVAYQQSISHYIQEQNSWGTAADARAFSASPDNQLAEQAAGISPHPIEVALFDQNGHVIIPGAGFRIGDSVNIKDLDEPESIQMNNQTVAYAIADGELPLSDNEKQFIHALEETLLFSIFAALAAILPLGIWGANRMANSLQHLTSAVNRMAEGHLEQQVPVNSRDEIGQLSQSFNSMNDQLVKTYRQLEESRALIARQAEKMKELSIRDELTGLYNRRFFNEEASSTQAAAISHQAPFTLVLGDVDHFKKINDNYSHATGDAVLQKIAEILQREIRATDLLARYGGEEIVLALPNTGPHKASEIINRIRQHIEDHPWHEIAENLQVTMSFGIADDYSDKQLEKQLDLADMQLYRAKNEGRNRVCSLAEIAA
ncbi:GGDEF domain-containing protein [Aliamphritea ceti]|uniref:GGDEF domain-containing protein n=1 Tax=Aliamphritea ceti TaxID=1524258 RepID=UPI0021C27835|nr:diguanylate cyclase [Aliamphritea ceti]